MNEFVTGVPMQCVPIQGNEVTRNHTITTRPARNGTISGSIRVQYSFLISKYPIGTFSVYSCLGSTEFTAHPVR
jgi:hypothetical protein